MTCPCFTCLQGVTDPVTGWPVTMLRMVLCETCGNKRCPHATDHREACTGSNSAGQKGSRYGGLDV